MTNQDHWNLMSKLSHGVRNSLIKVSELIHIPHRETKNHQTEKKT